MFGRRLEILFEQNNASQTDLAKYLNVAESTVSQWKTGKRDPGLQTVVKIAKFFNTTTDYLLGVSNNPSPVTEHPKHTNDDEKIFEARLTAGMEEEYGKKPSPEFVAFAKAMRREILEDIRKEKQDKSGE